MSSQNFLQPDEEQIRLQIQGCLDSYSHPWDLLSELAQNCVDAFRLATRTKGHFGVTVDAVRSVVIVTDNGCEIAAAELTKFLRPFGTNKRGKANQVGEKGVGLSFVIFSSDNFEIVTQKDGTVSAKRIAGASSWLANAAGQLNLDDIDETIDIGTRVEIKIHDEHALFDLTFEQLLYVLRTKTAFGDTGYIWDNPLNADVLLRHIDRGGKVKEVEFECKFMLPTDAAKDPDMISLSQYQDWLREKDRSDQEKRRKLLSKIVYNKGKKRQAGREISYWSCFVPQRAYWEQLSSSVGLQPNDETKEGDDALYVFGSGMETSTKGMPTGISAELKPRGSAGYLPQFYILIDDPSLSFDLGRKYIQSRQQGMLKDISYEQFREYINNVRKYSGGGLSENPSSWERDETFAAIDLLPNLDSTKSRFVKRPNGQEATVAAIYFELIGSNVVKEIRPLTSGYRGRYDLYAKWKNRNVVIEFKYDLGGLMKDFSDERKMFDEIDAVVVWEITESDRIEVERRGIALAKKERSSFQVREEFPNATQELRIESVKPIFVIELKECLAGT